ncbi:MAG: tripartite tricarboxylate transporter substrate-binding protein, partial [Xanthobacteraceae bacterium]
MACRRRNLPPSFTTRPTSGSASPRRPASRRNSFSPPGQACSLCLELESAWGQGCASYPSRVPKSDGRHCRCVSRFAQCLCAKLLSGFPPGGINDTYARLIGQWLSEHLGQQFIIENHPGVGGNLAAETVAKAEPDGYTLLLTTPADAWNATLYNNLNFNYARDFTPVATM